MVAKTGPAIGDKLTYRSLHGGNVAVVAVETGTGYPLDVGSTRVRVVSRKNTIYRHGMEIVASNVFLTTR